MEDAMKQVFNALSATAGSLTLLVLSGCAEKGDSTAAGFMYKNLPVASGSATAGEGNNVTMGGAPKALEGTGIKVGDSLRDVKVTKGDLSLINIAETKGRVRIISVVPSLDTKVCEQQTHYLSEKNNGLDKMVELITVIVVDKDNVVRYLQVTPELGQMPDMDAAFRFARSLIEKS